MTTLQSQREERFRALFADAYGDVIRFAQRRIHPTHVEDVVAEAFLVAWRRLDDAPSSHSDLRAWLFGITRNCLMNARRGHDRRGALAVRLAEVATCQAQDGGPDPDLISRRIDLASAWRRLSVGEQEVLALTVFEDLTSPQAARLIGISSAAYRLRLMRARRELRRHLDHADSASALDHADSASAFDHADSASACDPAIQESAS